MDLLGFALVLAAGTSRHVPFVGCPADGQAGPLAAPPRRAMPPVAAAAARRLAWYRSKTLSGSIRRGDMGATAIHVRLPRAQAWLVPIILARSGR